MKMQLVFICISYMTLYVNVLHVNAKSYEDSAKLWEHFFGEKGVYKRALRPVNNTDEALMVNISLGLRQIIHMEEKSQVMSAAVWVRLYWTDQILQWDAEDFNGTDTFYSSVGEIWTPDIVLLSSVAHMYEPSFLQNTIKVNNFGEILFTYPARLEVSCPLDISLFPFDEQTCRLLLGSWSYTVKELDLYPQRSNAVDLDVYEINSEWELTDMNVSRQLNEYLCCPDSLFPDITYTIKLSRKWKSLLFYLIVPIILIQGLAVIQFLLPCDSGEKVTLGVTVFLSMIVYLLMVSEMLPHQEVIPLVVQYLICTMILVAVSQSATVFVLLCHYNGNHDNHGMVRPWMRTFFLHWMAKVLMMERYITDDSEHIQILTAQSGEHVEIIPEENEDDCQVDWQCGDRHVSAANSACRRIDEEKNTSKNNSTDDLSGIQLNTSRNNSTDDLSDEKLKQRRTSKSSKKGKAKGESPSTSGGKRGSTSGGKRGSTSGGPRGSTSGGPRGSTSGPRASTSAGGAAPSIKTTRPSIADSNETTKLGAKKKKKTSLQSSEVPITISDTRDEHSHEAERRSSITSDPGADDFAKMVLMKATPSSLIPCTSHKLLSPSKSGGLDGGESTNSIHRISMSKHSLISLRGQPSMTSIKDQMDGIDNLRKTSNISMNLSRHDLTNISENNSVSQNRRSSDCEVGVDIRSSDCEIGVDSDGEMTDPVLFMNTNQSNCLKRRNNHTQSNNNNLTQNRKSFEIESSNYYADNGKGTAPRTTLSGTLKQMRINFKNGTTKSNQVGPGGQGADENLFSLVHEQFSSFAKRSTSDIHANKFALRESELKKEGNILLYQILRHCEDYKARFLNMDRDTEVKCEWQQVAMVIDRMVFVLLLICTVVAFIWFFSYIPR